MTPKAEAAHREPHPAHNHESSRIPPPREVQDACPGCLAGRDVQRMQDVGISTDPTVEAVMNALASSGAEWHGDHPCYGCAITLRDRLRKYGYDAALAAQPAPVVAPEGTKLVLMSDELMDVLASPSADRTVTWEWGEPDEHGWYTPTFTERAAPSAPLPPDDPLAGSQIAKCPHCGEELRVAPSAPSSGDSLDVETLARAAHNVWPGHPEGSGGTGGNQESYLTWRVLDPAVYSKHLIDAIAAEYARLRAAEPAGEPEG